MSCTEEHICTKRVYVAPVSGNCELSSTKPPLSFVAQLSHLMRALLSFCSLVHMVTLAMLVACVAEKGDMTRAGNQKFMGKLRGNMFGSEYLIFDEGENVKRSKKEKKAASAEGRGELGMVIFPKELIARGGTLTYSQCKLSCATAAGSLTR